MEFNRATFMLKGVIKLVLFVAAVFGLFHSGRVGWDKFREWAVTRKVTNTATRALAGVCPDDAACRNWMEASKVPCISVTMENRVERFAPELTAGDRRTLKSCFQKSLKKYTCSNDAKCLDRVEARYDKCYEYAYPTNRGSKVAQDAPTQLTACLYGFQFVQGDQGGGTTMEIVPIEKDKATIAAELQRDVASGGAPKGMLDGVEELKAELKRNGEMRRELFDEANNVLNEMREGTVDNSNQR